MVFSVDGERCFDIVREAPAETASALGLAAADALIELGAEALLARST
jgi:hypothetical protein